MFVKLLALVFLTLSLPAKAAIIDLGNITRDTDTGLEWLDVTETRGLSFDRVKNEFGAGGDYAGYRYATVAEFDQLMSNFGYVPQNNQCADGTLYCDNDIPGDSQIIESIIKSLGDTYDAWADESGIGWDAPSFGAGYTFGMLVFNDHNPNTRNLIPRAHIYDGELVNRNDAAISQDYNDLLFTVHDVVGEFDRYASQNAGSFLVRQVVPIPAAFWLFGSALLGLVGIGRKRKQV